ncbi:hypothetical protein LDENG_00109320 [Lucifuga dentata]|nr:hypothetical protein LDENG_00109320 [Lucifuga dentata]
MSSSCGKDDEGKTESLCRVWADSQPGPSYQSRQGYCGYCRVLYNNLEQHLSSLRHVDSVRASSRGSSITSSTSSSRTRLSLLERFLQDVLQHHPHHYSEPSDGWSFGTREDLPTSEDSSCQPANQKEDEGICSQPGSHASWERLSVPITEQEIGETAPNPEAQEQARSPPSVHRKAYRKTNHRENTDSSPSSSSRTPRAAGPRPRSDLRPWLVWEKERREAQKEEAFSSDHTDPMDQTIEEVIQMCCYGFSSASCHQGEEDSFHFILPDFLEAQSEDWDSPVQAVLQQRQAHLQGSHTPVQVSWPEVQDLSCLMDIQVNLEDRIYSHQLDFALHRERRTGGGAQQEEGYIALPVEQILPVPAHIPESFRGKTWPQIEQEDEQKVEALVRQFRREKFLCYFDSESLARFGRRSQGKMGRDQKEGKMPGAGVLPLLVHDEDEHVYVSKRRKRQGFRMASRCQVVKVSRSTQTVHLVVPAVRPLVPEATSASVRAANQDFGAIPLERTPEVQAGVNLRRLPPLYSSIITALQPQTSLVYICCLSSPVPKHASLTCPTSKRCRRKRRPVEHVVQGLKVKYKRQPFMFYDPNCNRILKNAPKGFLWRRSSTPSTKPPPACVRQLFRSLSPDLNSERPEGEKSGSGNSASGSSRVKSQRSSISGLSSATILPLSQSNGSHFVLCALSRNSEQTPKQETVRRRSTAPHTPPPPRAGRPARRRGGRRESTHPQHSAGGSTEFGTLPQSRREGLRRAGLSRKHPGCTGPVSPLHTTSPRRGRARSRSQTSS